MIARSVPSTLSLERSRRAVAQARLFVRERCREAGLPEEVGDTAVLLVSELVTNAVEHARSPVQVTVHADAGRVRIEVHDVSGALPAIRDASTGAVNGRGMAIVDSLATDWGVRPATRGKTIWFDLGSPWAPGQIAHGN